MTPSNYQKDIYNTILTKNSNVAIDAGPGSGKTTTIVEASKLIPYGKRAIFLAYNKKIVEELKERLPHTIQCSTMHSLGASVLFRSSRRQVQVKPEKQLPFIINHYQEEIDKKKKVWGEIFDIEFTMKLVRATMTNYKEKEELDQLFQDHNIFHGDKEVNRLKLSLDDFYEYNNREWGKMDIDFQDMIELIVRQDIPLPQFDYVFLDEAQDMSKLDRLFIEKLVKKPLGRLISVFDEKQTIYGWRGSDMDSVEYFSNRPNTDRLPLSICYRCPKSHIELAKTIYPGIEPFEKNGEGVLNREGNIRDIRPGDMVICRNNKPLVSLYFRLVRRGVPCKIIGKEIEKGLLNMVKRIEGENLDQGLENLDKIQRNYEKELKNKGISNLNRNPKWISFCDKVEVIKTIARRTDEEGDLVCDSMEDVQSIIVEMFEEKRYGDLVQLLTIHKSKGLENDRIFLITHHAGKQLMPSDHAITEKQKVQERNLMFVAYTRAKKELHFVKL